MNPMWRSRQRSAYAAMWRDIERRRRHERLVAGPLGWIVEGRHRLAITVAVFGALIVGVSFCSASRVLSLERPDYRVPMSCKPLAVIFGYPDWLRRDQALDALVRLEGKQKWPGVSACLKAAHKEWRL